ncbi:zinc finger, CCHC-type containing protein, partial [Tanacetum coccineum]
LDKFEGVDFRRWQKKMNFLLSNMSVVYVLTTPIPNDGDDATVDQLRKRAKWDNDDYVCRDSLEAKYMVEDASSKKFLVSNFTNYKMTDSRPVLEQYNELLGILGRFTQHKMNMDESIQEELTLVELGSHLRIEESLRMQDTSFQLKFYVTDPNDLVLINSIIELKDVIFDENRFSSVPRPSLRIPNGTEDIGGSVVLEEVTEKVVQQPEPNLRKSKRNRTPKDFGPEFQLYLIEETRDEKKTINDEMDSIMGNNTWVLADLPPGCKLFGCKWTFKRKLKVDGTIEKFKARLVIQGFKQKSEIDYFDTYAPMDVKTAFLNGDLDEEQAPKQWHQKFDEVVLSNGYLVNQVDKFVYSKFDKTGGANVILGIMIKHESNGIAISRSHYIKKALKKFNYFDCTPVSTPMDISEKLMPNNGQVVSQLEYYRLIGYLMYAMTCTRPDIVFVVSKLSKCTSNSVLEGYTDASWISNTEDNSSTSGWVFLLGSGVISWASKKQTCITGSIMESEFVALAVVGKQAEWLKNLLFDIPLWSKPIAPIYICCDSAATLAKAYSQMYNGKSRHLGVRHIMIHELNMNGVVSIEFVRSQ